jgi:hypothetical protein
MPQRLIGSPALYQEEEGVEGDNDDEEDDPEGYALAVTARSRRPSSYPL